MRLYHFVPSQYAIENLRFRRLKVALVDDLNDPFELWGTSQEQRELRPAFRSWRREMARLYGMLCFSSRWSNPVLWSHYADRHRGICLGFDVAPETAIEVTYVKERFGLKMPLDEETMRSILGTKFDGWSYEEEWRTWCRLEEQDDDAGLYFKEFDDQLVLKEVLTGPLCTSDTAHTLAPLANELGCSVTRTRLAFRSFTVTEDQRGWPIM